MYDSNNKEVAEKIYNKIQNKIIELNAKNESGSIDIEAIIKEVENEMQGL